MGEAGTAQHWSLPVQSNPAHAVKSSLDRLSTALVKAEKALAPSFWRRILGGTNRDHARAVVAASMEEARAVRGVISDARKAAFRADAKALAGSVDRIMKSIDQWSQAAIEFDEAVFGADAKLLARTRKLIVLCSDLRNPASGLT